MDRLTVTTDDHVTSFTPGSTVSGVLSWELQRGPEALELRLFWYTEGKGTQDVEVVATHRIEGPASTGSESFSLVLPDSPYSFSGKLITLAWALELVALPEGSSQRLDIVMSPSGSEIVLSRS